MHPNCKIASDRGLTNYPKEEHERDCDKCQGPQPSQHWIEDCMKWWGRVLDGKNAHWCPDWDDLPIDVTYDEFECCTCDF